MVILLQRAGAAGSCVVLHVPAGTAPSEAGRGVLLHDAHHLHPLHAYCPLAAGALQLGPPWALPLALPLPALRCALLTIVHFTPPMILQCPSLEPHRICQIVRVISLRPNVAEDLLKCSRSPGCVTMTQMTLP